MASKRVTIMLKCNIHDILISNIADKMKKTKTTHSLSNEINEILAKALGIEI